MRSGRTINVAIRTLDIYRGPQTECSTDQLIVTHFCSFVSNLIAAKLLNFLLAAKWRSREFPVFGSRSLLWKYNSCHTGNYWESTFHPILVMDQRWKGYNLFCLNYLFHRCSNFNFEFIPRDSIWFSTKCRSAVEVKFTWQTAQVCFHFRLPIIQRFLHHLLNASGSSLYRRTKWFNWTSNWVSKY